MDAYFLTLKLSYPFTPLAPFLESICPFSFSLILLQYQRLWNLEWSSSNLCKKKKILLKMYFKLCSIMLIHAACITCFTIPFKYNHRFSKCWGIVSEDSQWNAGMSVTMHSWCCLTVQEHLYTVPFYFLRRK